MQLRYRLEIEDFFCIKMRGFFWIISKLWIVFAYNVAQHNTRSYHLYHIANEILK